MRLKLLEPTAVLVDEEVSKVVAEAADGSFCLLPRHIDFVAAIVPSVLFYWPVQGEQRLAAVNEGILVKRGEEVLVSVLNAVLGGDLTTLEDEVEKQFRQLDEHARRARSAVARLEAGAIRRFMAAEEGRRG